MIRSLTRVFDAGIVRKVQRRPPSCTMNVARRAACLLPATSRAAVEASSAGSRWRIFPSVRPPSLAEPSQNGTRQGRERSDHARMGVAALRQRQQHEFHVLRPAFGGAAACARDHDPVRFVRDRVEQVREREAALCASHRLRNGSFFSSRPNSAQTRVPARRNGWRLMAVEFQDEHVAQRAADRARLDLAAFRRGPRSPPCGPIAEQFAARSLFHCCPPRRIDPGLSARARPGSGQRRRQADAARGTEQGMCRWRGARASFARALCG